MTDDAPGGWSGAGDAEPTAAPMPIAPPLVPPSASAADPRPLDPAPPSGPATPNVATVPGPRLVTTRALIGASFELLTRTSAELRRASFYIGTIVLGTVGPLALAVWALDVVAVDPSAPELDAALAGARVALSGLAALAAVGIVVAVVESRTLSMGMLGGVVAGRPVTLREALTRSRRTFWLAVAATAVVGVVIGVVQAIVDAVLGSRLAADDQFSVLTSTLVSAFAGAPFAYVLAGVVLGGVGPMESIRRSFRVARARPGAAVLVAGFETVTAVLIVLGIDSGLDLVLRVLGAFGLGPTSGPLGLAVVTMLLVAGIFAVGTLLFTITALTIAPQVLMFLGLTHASFGLDTVRRGGADDPDLAYLRGRFTFRWIPRPMLLGFILGGLGLAAVIVLVRGW